MSYLKWICCIGLLFILIAVDLFYKFDSSIFYSFRLPRVIAAFFCGVSLAITGIVMQTFFRNPLAGPYILGIAPGASMVMSIVILFLPIGLGQFIFAQSVLTFFAIAASVMILFLQILIYKKNKNLYTLLLVGIMLGYIFSAVTEILQVHAGAEQNKNFILWGQGNFDRVFSQQFYYFIPIVCLGFLFSIRLIPQLDNYFLGEKYAVMSGIQLNKFYLYVLLLVGILSGTTTAVCGPIGFIGIAAPHLARIILRSNSHSATLILSCILGSALCISADIVTHIWFQTLGANLNAICALLGAPIVLHILFKLRKSSF